MNKRDYLELALSIGLTFAIVLVMVWLVWPRSAPALFSEETMPFVYFDLAPEN